STGVGGQREQRRRVEDRVVGVRRAARPARGVRARLQHVVRDRVVEVNLRREVDAARGAHAVVDVYGAPRVPARIDGRELHGAVRVGDLIPAPDAPAGRAGPGFVGVDAARV